MVGEASLAAAGWLGVSAVILVLLATLSMVAAAAAAITDSGADGIATRAFTGASLGLGLPPLREQVVRWGARRAGRFPAQGGVAVDRRGSTEMLSPLSPFLLLRCLFRRRVPTSARHARSVLYDNPNSM